MPELRELLDTMADEGQPRGAYEVMRRARAQVGGEAASSRPRRGAGFLVAAAAIVTVIATAMSLVVFRESDPELDRAVGNIGRPGRWDTVSFSKTGFESGARVFDVAPFSRGLVAVGHVRDVNTGGNRAVWTSPDGRHWDRARGPRLGSGSVDIVVAGDDEIFAFATGGEEGSTVWRSKEGRRWHRLTEEAPVGITTVVAGGPGLVAGGFRYLRNTDDPIAVGAIWTSQDGVRWSPVPNSRRLFASSGHITGITRDEERFVAMGSDAPEVGGPQRGGHAAVWTSNDGTEWTRTDGGAGLRPLRLGAVGPVANEAGELMVLGLRRSRRSLANPSGECFEAPNAPAVWGSNLGRRWTRISEFGAIPGAYELEDAGDWWLAGGERGTCERHRSFVYISSNGKRWSVAKADPRSTPSSRTISAISATSTGAVVVLHPDRPSDSGPAVWLWTAPR